MHIATHGLLDAERPQFTGVVLSLIGNKTTDGFLRTDEIFNLKLGAPLVMFSACETGLGKEKRGEGVIGLTRAFMYAGAPTVGVSLWSVADKSTADLMTEFYNGCLRPMRFLRGRHARCATVNDHRQEIQRAFLLGAIRAGGRVAVKALNILRNSATSPRPLRLGGECFLQCSPLRRRRRQRSRVVKKQDFLAVFPPGFYLA